MRGLAVALAFGLCAASASAQDVAPNTARAKWYTVAEWSMFACHALDDGYTQRLLGTGQFHESSPLLGQFTSPGVMIGVKFGMSFGQAKGMRTLARKGHPIVAAVTNAATAGVMCGAAWHNKRLFDQFQKGR